MGAPAAIDVFATCTILAQPEPKTRNSSFTGPHSDMTILLGQAQPCRLATADDLPNELLLLIFPHLALASLMVARSVCRRWRSLVHASQLSPIRRRYLEAYIKAASAASPVIQRGTTVGEGMEQNKGEEGKTEQRCARKNPDNEREREAFLEEFKQLAVRVPEELVQWIREWPCARGWLTPVQQSIPSECVDGNFSGICGSGAGGGLSGDAAQGPDYQNGVGNKLVPALLYGGEPHVKSVSFSGRMPESSVSLLNGSTVLHATRILPAELAGLTLILSDGMNFAFGGEGETMEDRTVDQDASKTETCTNIELMLLCLGDGRCYVLDGKHGGEELVGVVYSVHDSYTMRRENIVARSWLELVEGDIEERCQGRAPRRDSSCCVPLC